MATTTIDLIRVLEDAGIERLHAGSKEVSGACPMHVQRTGHPDTHPSWSINRNTYLHNCFACGYKGNLETLLVDVTGANPVDLMLTLREQALLRQWQQVRAEPEPIVTSILPKLSDWAIINVLKDVPQRFLERRRLKREAIDQYQVRYSPDTKQVVMPLRSPGGDLLGAQYRQVGSVLTLPKDVAKSTTLFGYSVMSDHDYVALVESPLDAVRLFGLGVPALSSLGAWVSAEQCRLLARAFTTVYLALDNDKAGRSGSAIARRSLRKQGTAVVEWDYTDLVDENGEKAKDVGDAADDDMLAASWQRTQRFGM